MSVKLEQLRAHCARLCLPDMAYELVPENLSAESARALQALLEAYPGVLAELQQRLAPGLRLVVEERDKQLRYGFDSDHDDRHADGSLVACARTILNGDADPATGHWWDQRAAHVCEKHGRDPVQLYTIVASLLLAEIERYLRLQAAQKGQS